MSANCVKLINLTLAKERDTISIKNPIIKILILTKYTRKGPSSRVRFLNYRPYLEKDGYYFKERPFFDDDYIINIYDNKRLNVFKLLYYYIRRIYALITQLKYDLIWLEGECFPWLPFFIEKLFLWKGVVVDYDDAIFHKYDHSSSLLVRTVLSQKIPLLMKNASHVIVANKYLAKKALGSRENNIHLIPTTVDLNKYKNFSKKTNNEKRVIIGWIGNTNTIKYLENISNTIISLRSKVEFDLYIVGAKSKILQECGAKFFEWTEKDEIDLISMFDIGIMPLNDSPWEKGKSGYKLIQYMACQKPVVASPIGANIDIVSHQKDGFLAQTPDEWIFYLEMLILNSDLRERFGSNGYIKVCELYNTSLYTKKLIKIFKNVNQKRGNL